MRGRWPRCLPGGVGVMVVADDDSGIPVKFRTATTRPNRMVLGALRALLALAGF